MYARIRKRYLTILAVGRQFTHLVNKSGSITEGINELKKIASREHQYMIAALERAFTDESSSDDKALAGIIGPYGILQKLVFTIKREGGNPLAVFAGFDRMLLPMNDQLRALWVSIGGFLLYMTFVLAVAAIIFTVLLIFVLPQFEEMFGAFGGNLPALTEWIAGNNAKLFYALLCGFALLILAMLLVVFHVFDITGRLIPLSRMMRRVPFMRNVTVTYNRLLALNYARLLLGSGLSSDRSLEISANLANDAHLKEIAAGQSPATQSTDQILSAIKIAKAADNLEAELDYQINDQNFQLASDFDSARQQTMFVGHVLLAVFVGVVVIAMYLPIFKMGEIG